MTLAKIAASHAAFRRTTQRTSQRAGWGAICALMMLAALVLAPAAGIRGQEALVIRAGEPVEGSVRSRLGEEWRFQGCAEDVITLRAASDDFVPLLALFDALSPDALVEVVGDEEELEAAIEEFVLPSAGSYSVLVSGSNVSDRGDYALTLERSADSATDDPDVAQIAPGQSVAGEVTSRFGSEVVFFGCADQAVSFTLESAAFVPVLELFGPSGRDPLAVGEGSVGEGSDSLAQISAFTLPETGVYTLVAGGESVLARGSFTLAMLDAGSQPPTATPTPTNSPTPTSSPTPLPTFTPTPTQQPSAILPQGIPIQVNGGDGDLLGEVFCESQLYGEHLRGG